MAESLCDNPRKCPACGAVVEPPADHCWFCREEFPSADVASSLPAATTGQPFDGRSATPPQSPAEPPAAPPVRAALSKRASSPSAAKAADRSAKVVLWRLLAEGGTRQRGGAGAALSAVLVVAAVYGAILGVYGSMGALWLACAAPGLVIMLFMSLFLRPKGVPVSQFQIALFLLKCVLLVIVGAALWWLTFVAAILSLCSPAARQWIPANLTWGVLLLDIVGFFCLVGVILFMANLWPRR